DIVIDQLEGPRFLGPIDEEEQAQLEAALRHRDVLIIQHALDRRSTTRLDGTPLTEPGSAILLAMVMDRFVPKRLRFSEIDWINAVGRYKWMPKRQLLKLLYSSWRELGVARP